MKKLQKLSLSKMIDKLTRNEMRYVIAGSGTGTCAVMMTNGDGEVLVVQNISLAEVTSAGGNGGGNQWCCDSCSDASWIDSCNIC